MRTTPEDETPLTLVIQRLMDADLLLPDEGSALLAEIDAFDRARDEAHGEVASESREAYLPMLEALLQTDRLDGSIAGQAREIVRRIFQRAGQPD